MLVLPTNSICHHQNDLGYTKTYTVNVRQSATIAVSTYEYFNVEFRSGLRIKEHAEITFIGVSKST